MRRGLYAVGLFLFIKAPGGLTAAGIQISTDFDPRFVAQIYKDGHLEELHQTLGTSLTKAYTPFGGWHSGAVNSESYGKWVDLYNWIDLIESDEASVTKRWLSRHLSVAAVKTTHGDVLHATIHQPGSPLVRRYDRVQHLATEQLASDAGMLHQALSVLVSQPFEPRNGRIMERLEPGFIEATLEDENFWSAWESSFDEDDFAPKALLNLQSIWQSSPSDWKEFRNLALAVSLVHDQPVPNFWPHRQVHPDNVPRVSQQSVEIFKGFVRAFREGNLRLDLRLLQTKELTYLVDAPIAPSEYEWVRSSGALSHEKPPQAFESINYDLGRVERDAFVWPWGTYSFASIGNHGGICVDQAYYAAISGKALGFPTLFFSGEGPNGGHAWVGYLKASGHWDINVGRHGSETVETGVALNPQNWAPITDHEVSMIAHGSGNLNIFKAAKRDLIMASAFRRCNDAVDEGVALRSARARCPDNPLIWDALEDWLLRTDSSVRELERHHEEAIRQFSRSRDLKAQHQAALARLAAQVGDTGAQKNISERIIRENLGVRNDLSANAAGQLISSQMESNAPEVALDSYEEQLRRQALVGKGDFFYRVTAPLAEEFLAKGRPDLARRVLKKAYDAINPVKGSLVDKEFRKMWRNAGGKS